MQTRKKLTDEQKQLLSTFAELNMNAKQTAKKLYTSETAVHYQLKKIKEKTGTDPKTFTGLTELLKGAKEIC